VIHLDASFLIRALVRGSAEDHLMREWLAGRKPLAITAIAWTEFCCGPVSETAPALPSALPVEVLPFDAEDAERSARLYNLADRRRGTLIDSMIAAAAIRWGAQLATANPKDFRAFSVAGLEVIEM
jgi:predicted nucleic acid-binding protein